MIICDQCKTKNLVKPATTITTTIDGLPSLDRTHHMCTEHAKEFHTKLKKIINFDYESQNGEKEEIL